MYDRKNSTFEKKTFSGVLGFYCFLFSSGFLKFLLIKNSKVKLYYVYLSSTYSMNTDL